METPAAGHCRGRCWHELGFNVLLPDLRAHGDSGGTRSTGGVAERQDVLRLVDDLRHRRPLETRQLYLAGISFGAMTAAAAASRASGLEGLVLDSPIDHWMGATRRWGALFSLPPAGRLAHRIRMWMADGTSSEPPDTAHDVALAQVPTFAILPRHDVLLPDAEGDAIAAAVEAVQRGTVWRPEVGHNEAIVAHPGDYVDRLATWLDQSSPGDGNSLVDQ